MRFLLLFFQEDRILQKQKSIPTKKLKTLEIVLPQLKKEDLKVHFCSMGLLDVVADWLTPTSNNILPPLKIRDELIHQLLDVSLKANLFSKKYANIFSWDILLK